MISITHFRKQRYSILTVALTVLVSLNTIGQVISNPTVLNSMTLSNVTPVSATLSWMYRSDEFDSAPVYILYSRTASETFYNYLASVSLGFISASQSIQSQSINVSGLQPNTTYTWFLNVQDEALGMSEPLLMNNYNNAVFLGYSFLTTSTYQTITFTTPNASGTGGAAGVTTTVSNSIIPPNQPPVASAGVDVAITSPVNSTRLNGLGSLDVDGGIQNFTWSKVGGPLGITFNTMEQYSPTPALSNLLPGTYTYRLVVYDSRGSFAQDFVDVVVDGGGLNQLPSAFAGIDRIISLPPNSSTTSITLNGSGADSDGFITNYLWTKISGPNSFNINSPVLTATTVSNLVPGTYSFQLTVTDNRGGISSDVVNITINGGATPGACSNDNFESNNTSGTAASISVRSTIQAKLCPLTDVDFFRFDNRNAQKNIKVTLSNLPSKYVLELFAPGGNLVGTTFTPNTSTKVIVFNTTTVGTYRIKVSAGIGAVVSNNSYSLLAETSRNNFLPPVGTVAKATSNVPQLVAPGNIELVPAKSFTVYPNPAANVINVATPANEMYKSISIISQTGQELQTITPQKNITSLNIAGLKQGVYLVKAISVSGETYTKKIVIIR